MFKKKEISVPVLDVKAFGKGVKSVGVKLMDTSAKDITEGVKAKRESKKLKKAHEQAMLKLLEIEVAEKIKALDLTSVENAEDNMKELKSLDDKLKAELAQLNALVEFAKQTKAE